MVDTERNLLIKELKKSDWAFPMELFPLLSKRDLDFVSNEFTEKRSCENYLKRIKHLGITNCDRVLDAGCGMGQWSVAFAKLNNKVEGIDVDSGRLFVANELIKSTKLESKVNFQYASLEEIPFQANSFDAVFCYSVIMLTSVKKSLKEFNRVLKPGGKLYVMTDLWPWYLRMIRKDARSIYSILKMAILQITMSKKYFFSEKWFLKQVKNAGFENIDSKLEGYASFVANSASPTPDIIFYNSLEGKKKALIEIIANKPSEL